MCRRVFSWLDCSVKSCDVLWLADIWIVNLDELACQIFSGLIQYESTANFRCLNEYSVEGAIQILFYIQGSFLAS